MATPIPLGKLPRKLPSVRKQNLATKKAMWPLRKYFTLDAVSYGDTVSFDSADYAVGGSSISGLVENFDGASLLDQFVWGAAHDQGNARMPVANITNHYFWSDGTDVTIDMSKNSELRADFKDLVTGSSTYVALQLILPSGFDMVIHSQNNNISAKFNDAGTGSIDHTGVSDLTMILRATDDVLDFIVSLDGIEQTIRTEDISGWSEITSQNDTASASTFGVKSFGANTGFVTYFSATGPGVAGWDDVVKKDLTTSVTEDASVSLANVVDEIAKVSGVHEVKIRGSQIEVIPAKSDSFDSLTLANLTEV